MVALDADDKPMAEIVLSKNETLELIELCQKVLYNKAANQD